jgi:prepilin signal peptidase PulO-like enzyme (type II secretory pathway)
MALFIVVSALISFIIYLTNGKGMGFGDILLFGFVIFSLGARLSIAALLITIYLAAIIGTLYALYRRKFKNLLVPLAPFIFLSWLIVLTFPELASTLLSLYQI